MGILLNGEEIWAVDKTIPENSDRNDEWYYERFYLKAQLRKVAEWGNGLCPHFAPIIELKRGCFDCWQELRKECE